MSTTINNTQMQLTASSALTDPSYIWQSSKDGVHWMPIDGATSATFDASPKVGLFVRAVATGAVATGAGATTTEYSSPVFVSTGAPVRVDPPSPYGGGDFSVAFSAQPGVIAKDPGDYNVAWLDSTGLTGSVGQQVIEANPETPTPKSLKITHDGSVVYTVVENPDGSFEVSNAIGQTTTLIGFDGVGLDRQTFNLHLDIYDGDDSVENVKGTPWQDALVVDLAVDPDAYTWQDVNGVKSLTNNTDTLVVIEPSSKDEFVLKVTVTTTGTGGSEQIYRLDDQVESLAIAHNGAPVANLEWLLSGANPVNPAGSVQNGVFHKVDGTAANDTNLTGTDERDWLDGWGGADRLTGGTGQDVFSVFATETGGVFWSGSTFDVSGADVITDFKAGEQDIIQLHRFVAGDSLPLTLESSSTAYGTPPAVGQYALIYGTVDQTGVTFTPSQAGSDTLIVFDDESSGLGGVLVLGATVAETDINRVAPEVRTYDMDWDGKPEIQGTTEPGATVTVYNDSKVAVGTVTADFEGIYNVEIANTASANYVVSASLGGQPVQPDLAVVWTSNGQGGGTPTDGEFDFFVYDRDGNGLPEIFGRVPVGTTVTLTAPGGTAVPITVNATTGAFDYEFASAPVSGAYTLSDGTSAVSLVFGTGGDDTGVTGTADSDGIFAGNGDDVVDALAGDDHIVFSRGHDTIDGGADFDTLELPFDPSVKTLVRDVVDSAGVVHIQTYQQGMGFVDAFTVKPGTTADHTLVTAVKGGHTADLVNVERIAMADFELALVPAEFSDVNNNRTQALGTRGDDQFQFTTSSAYDPIADVDGGEGKDTVTINFTGVTLATDGSGGYTFLPSGSTAGSEQTISLKYYGPEMGIGLGSSHFRNVETLILKDDSETPNTFELRLADLQRKSDGAGAIDVDDENEIADGDVGDAAWLSAAKTVINGFRVLDGKGGDDRLVGTDVDDVDEKDHLLGGLGNDRLEGRGGYNLLDGGEGNDEASYAMADRGVKVDIFRTDEQATGVSQDTILNVENLLGSAHADTLGGNGWSNALDGNAGHDELFGGRGHDILLGGDGHDFLDGGIGNDTLNGGKGSDVLKGGVGADIFVFDAMDFYFSDPHVIPDIDTILDFNSFADQIKVINAGSAATLEYDNTTGELLYDADGVDPGAAQVIATMEAGLGLSGAHWVL